MFQQPSNPAVRELIEIARKRRIANRAWYSDEKYFGFYHVLTNTDFELHAFNPTESRHIFTQHVVIDDGTGILEVYIRGELKYLMAKKVFADA